MTFARKNQVCLDATPYYHCVSRCVRRAFLCGTDDFSGRSYEHRRQWIEDRILELADAFAIDVAGYAIMHNHTHLVLHVNRDRARNWSTDEVIKRWCRLFSGNLLAKKRLQEETMISAELDKLMVMASTWRERLHDISWFMRCLNEHIARLANKEDQCTGRFWEGRFKCQALLDKAALAACLAYVDLNPIRAGIADKLETSDYTSIQQRIIAAVTSEYPSNPQQPAFLLPFAGKPGKGMSKGLPFRLEDYLALVDWTRTQPEDNRGTTVLSAPAILENLGFEPRHWLYLTSHFEHRLKNLVGSVNRLKAACTILNKHWCHGMAVSRQYFPS